MCFEISFLIYSMSKFNLFVMLQKMHQIRRMSILIGIVQFSMIVYIDEKNEKIMYEKDFHIAESKYVNMLLDIFKEKYL